MRHISTNISIKTGFFLRVFTHFYRGLYGFLAYFEQENYSSERTLLFFEICNCVAKTFSQNILEKKPWGYFNFVGKLRKKEFFEFYSNSAMQKLDNSIYLKTGHICSKNTEITAIFLWGETLNFGYVIRCTEVIVLSF
jgi:hypothetical protein